MATMTKGEALAALLTANAELAALRTTLAAREVQIEVLKGLLEEAKARVPNASPAEGEVVARYTRADGTHWIKVRIDYKTCVHRQVLSN